MESIDLEKNNEKEKLLTPTSTSQSSSKKSFLYCLLATFLLGCIIIGILGGLGYLNQKSESEVSFIPLWSSWTNGTTNQRWAKSETKISTANVGQLKVKWAFNSTYSLSMNPLVVGERVYFHDLGNILYCVNRFTGELLWELNIPQLWGQEDVGRGRGTGVVYGKTLLIGTPYRAILLCLDQLTGEVLWQESLDEHPHAKITASLTVLNDNLFIGISANEEGAAYDDNYTCCTFRGSLVKFHIPNRTILWRFYTVPDNHGDPNQYAGNAVWGSQPPIDLIRNQIYIATGNNYHVPQSVIDCQKEQDLLPTPVIPNPCIEDDNYLNSVIAIDLDSGEEKWSMKSNELDAYVIGCLDDPKVKNCPEISGPDYDFPSAPIYIQHPTDPNFDIVIAGQKTGILWAFHPNNGTILWSTSIGPDGIEGGLMWGSAADENNVYYGSSNFYHKNHTLIRKDNLTITWGSWGAVEQRSGDILWQTPAPSQGVIKGPTTIANGVIYSTVALSPDGLGHLHALDMQTGDILFSYETSFSDTISGPAIVDGYIYWSSDAFYAFSLE